MNYLMQLSIILGVSFAGEALRALLPLPIPAGVYGLCLMLALLMTGAIKPAQVRPAAGYLIEIMPVMFIPAVVGLMDSLDSLLAVLLPFLLALTAITVAVMAVTGCVAQGVMRLEGRNHDAGVSQ